LGPVLLSAAQGNAYARFSATISLKATSSTGLCFQQQLADVLGVNETGLDLGVDALGQIGQARYKVAHHFSPYLISAFVAYLERSTFGEACSCHRCWRSIQNRFQVGGLTLHVLRAIWFAEAMLLHPRLLCLPEAFL
jgi:hypothetical protein